MYSERDLSESNVEKVTRILESSNFEDLTPETLLQAYQEEGIRSLEDLTERITAAIKDPEGRPQRINYEASFNTPTPREVLEKIEHKVPKVPFIVKGVEYDPEDIVRFNGKELLFIADARPGASEMIVLEDKSVWSSFLQTNILATLLVRNGTVLPHESRTWDIPEMTPAVTPKLPQSVIDEAGDSIGGQAEIDAAERQKQAELENKKWQREKEAKRQREGGGVSPTGMGGGNSSATGEGGVIIIGNGENKRWGKPTTENVTLYSDTWWTGYDLKLAPGDLYNNLAKVSLMGILGWTWDDWNDEVESISPTFMCCIFGDHVGFEGSRLVFNYTRYGYPDLEQIGWKERISSVWNYGSTDPQRWGGGALPIGRITQMGTNNLSIWHLTQRGN